VVNVIYAINYLSIVGNERDSAGGDLCVCVLCLFGTAYTLRTLGLDFDRPSVGGCMSVCVCVCVCLRVCVCVMRAVRKLIFAVVSERLIR